MPQAKACFTRPYRAAIGRKASCRDDRHGRLKASNSQRLFHDDEFIIAMTELHGFGMIERMQAILAFDALDQ